MDKKIYLENMLKYPEAYMNTQQKTLEKRIAETNISVDEYRKSIEDSSKQNLKGVGRELAESTIPGLSVILEVLDWNKNVDEDLTEVKRATLISDYFDKVDSHEKALKDLIDAFGNIYGNTLINKIFRMLDNYPPDGDLLNQLAVSLRKVCESKNFEKLFDIHKFFLSAIEKMSPQALTILLDYEIWPSFNFEFSGMSYGNDNISEIIGTTDYQRPFVEKYFKVKSIGTFDKKQTGVYAINELDQAGFIKCYKIKEEFYLKLSPLGEELYKYLK